MDEGRSLPCNGGWSRGCGGTAERRRRLWLAQRPLPETLSNGASLDPPAPRLCSEAAAQSGPREPPRTCYPRAVFFTCAWRAQSALLALLKAFNDAKERDQGGGDRRGSREERIWRRPPAWREWPPCIDCAELLGTLMDEQRHVKGEVHH